MVANPFQNKRVLITGATGTVGMGLTLRLLALGARTIRVYSRDETKQFEMSHQLSEHHRVMRYLIGDIRDKERLDRALEDVDYVFHLAALKHVNACEYNPFEAIKTNIVGSQNVIEMSIKHGVKRVLFTSSDKAANPSNAMGASKLMAERLFTAANHYKGRSQSVFFSTRLGNVLGSRGSLIPLICDQLGARKAVTLTDVTMTRFITTVDDIVDFLMYAMTTAEGGEILVPKMPSVRTLDLLHAIIHCYCRKHGRDARREIARIVTVGARPGEKNYEDLITEEESTRAFENKRCYKVVSLLEGDARPKGKRAASAGNFQKTKYGAVASRAPEGGFLTVRQTEKIIQPFI